VQARRTAGRTWRKASVFAVAFALASCGTTERRHPSSPPRLRPSDAPAPADVTVVILTIDGARSREVFQGTDPALARAQRLRAGRVLDARALVPNISSLAANPGAALGVPRFSREMRASGPNFVSLPGYAELLTGRGPSFCRDNGCRGPSEPTLLDELTARYGCSPQASAVVTSWPDIGRIASQHAECITMSSGRHGGSHLERFRQNAPAADRFDAEARADPFPGHGDFRPDHLTASQALAYLEREEPRFLFVGTAIAYLYAHRNDYDGYLGALSEADRWVGAFTEALSRMAARGRKTALFVTADHGRAASFVEHGADYPESAAVWLVATGSEIDPHAAPIGVRPRRLADVTPTVRRMLDLPPDHSQRAGAPLFELLRDRLED